MVVDIGKTLVAVGLGMVLLGGILWLSGGTLKNLPIGHLPGDILIQRGNFTVYVPLTTGLLLSLGLSGLLWLFNWLSRG